MNIELCTSDPLAIATPALIIGCCEGSEDGLFARCNSALDGCLQRLGTNGEFTGRVNTAVMLHTMGKLPAERLLLVGLGKSSQLDELQLRKAAGSAMQQLRMAKVTDFVSGLAFSLPTVASLRAVCEGALLGSYCFDEYKTRGKEERVLFSTLRLPVPEGMPLADAHCSIGQAEALCRGVLLARDLVSHPGNVATTGYLAAAAHALAERRGLTCRVLELDDLEKLGMNALIAVGKGSVHPPRLIVLEYGSSDSGRPQLLIGKGITFDSGGISIKPAAGMEEMKTDMAGAAAVLGTLEAAAGLGLPVHLVGIIAAAENMPDGKAFKPGDILTTMAGLTVEITNTDAEGRLVLADALHYALKKYRPAAMIDLATLTGACVVALGHEASGLMGSDSRLIKQLKAAGERCGERLWEFPLWEAYGEALKSDIADLKNSGGRNGGSITAGWFLKQFSGSARWAHLDIAGTAWNDKGGPCTPKGATGVGVRLLIEYLRCL